MRIAFLTPLWPPSMAQNGIATYVDIMSRALERKGHECVVIPMWAIGDVEDSRMFPVRLPRLNGAEKLLRRVRHKIEGGQLFDYNFFGRGVANALIDADRQKPIDILEGEESFGLARYCLGVTGAPVVLRAHGPHYLVHQPPFDRNDRRRENKEGLAFREADAASFPSRALCGAVSAHYGADFPLSATYPNPVDIAPSDEAWTLDGCDRNTILFIGRFDRIKGSDIALEAFAIVAENRPDIRLVMAGADNGIRGKDGVVLNFADYVRAHLPESIRERIDFLGPVPREDIPKLRRRALINMTASRFETFSYAAVEALALGAPTIATATPGLTEYLTDGDNILFAPVGDAQLLAQQIARCLDDHEFSARMGEKGREAAIRLFSPDAIAARAEDFYAEIIGRAMRTKAALS